MDPLPYLAPLPGPDFQPRSGQLIAAGILLIIAGCVTGCISAATPLALINPQLQAGQTRQILVGMAMYPVITLILAWLGIGILLPRRWARPLILILATHWLILGAISTLGMIVMAPMMRDFYLSNPSASGPGFANGILVITILILLITFVIWPLTVLLLLRGEAVRQTIEWKDSAPRWTDACPMSVLSLVVTLIVVALFAMLAAAQPALPILGIILRQPFPLIGGLLLAAVLLYAARLAYRQQMRGWWLGLLAVMLPLLAYVPNAWLIPLADFYAASGMPRQQIEPFLRHESTIHATMAIFPIIFATAWLIYMLRLRPAFIAAQKNPPIGAS